MRYAFLTDIHLDCLSDTGLQQFLTRCQDPSVDGYLISGDIATAPNLERYLRTVAQAFGKPVYFCLGNHDFWYGSIKQTRRSLASLSIPNTHYVLKRLYFPLSDETALVGHDGWYDGLHGDARNSNFLMNDWWSIKEFKDVLDPSIAWYRGGSRLDVVSRSKVIELSQYLASEAAKYVLKGIESALKQGFQKVLVLTHVPPWQEAHVHEGKPGGDYASPWFTSKIMGDMLEEVASRHQAVEFTVLCGHTHGRIDVQILENLTCRVGGADYTNPEVQFVVDV